MPRWATAAVFGATIVIAAVLWLVTDVNVALLVLLVAVVGTAVVVLWSRAVEGGRKATPWSASSGRWCPRASRASTPSSSARRWSA
jgi:membrane protein implicated in regulation of membrane protease activity